MDGGSHNISKEDANEAILEDIIFALQVGQADSSAAAPSPSQAVPPPGSKPEDDSAPQIHDWSEEVNKTLLQKFGIDESSFQQIRSLIGDTYLPGEVELSIEALQFENLFFTKDDEFLECRLKLGKEETYFSPKISPTCNNEWRCDVAIGVNDILNDILELQFWHLEPKGEIDHFGKNWLKSLDSLGQRLRSSFRTSGIIHQTSEEEANPSSGNAKSASSPSSPKEKENWFSQTPSSSQRASTSDLSSISSREKAPESSWMQSAFATFRHSKKRKTFSRSSSFEIRGEVDTSMLCNSLSKANHPEHTPKEAEPVDKAITENPDSSKDIKVKNEVSVQRQYTPPNDHVEGFQRRHNKSGDSLFGSLRNRSLKMSPKKDMQFWKRMSMTFQEKITEALEAQCIVEEENSKVEGIATPRRRSSLVREHMSNIYAKEKLGSIYLSLMECFNKSNCSNWTAEVDSILATPCSTKREQELIGTKVSVSLRWRSRAEAPHSHSAFECFKFALEKLFDPILVLESPDKDDLCIPLPVNRAGKIILKKIAFAFDMTDAEVSLASWLVICQRISRKSFEAPSEGGSTDTSRRGEIDFFIHPEYIYRWLLKLDALGSHYTMEEHKQLGHSLFEFIKKDVATRFRRLHAAFPMSHKNNLILLLRCCLLASESASLLHSVRQHTEVNPQWAVSYLIDATKEHASNWSTCLIEEMAMQQNLSFKLPKSLSHDGMLLPSACKSLVSNINKVEIVLMAVNDFLILGEKVYEPAFQSELNTSYMSVIWRTIGQTTTRFLEPLRKELLNLYPQGLLKNQVRELLEIHPSLWILLLQLSKLYRFQTRNEAQDFLNWYLPETFCETFLLVTFLWADFALVRAMDTMALEIEADSFVLRTNEGSLITSSAQEIVNVVKVMEERLSLLSLPGGYVSKGKISEFLLPKMLEMVRKYRNSASEAVLNRSSPQNTISMEMSSLATNTDIICQEMGDFFASLYTCRDRCKDKVELLKKEVKGLCSSLLSKRLPGLSHLVATGLSKNDDEEAKLFITSAIMSILQPLETCASNSQTIVIQFWNHIFVIFKNQQRKLVQTDEFRRLGLVLETLYFNFKSCFGIQHTIEAEQAYQEFMEHNLMKSMPSEDIIQRYYTERYEEQCTIHSSTSQQLIVNAYYNKNGKGLILSIYIAPSVQVQNLEYPKASSCRSSCSNLADDPLRKPRFGERSQHRLLSKHAKEVLLHTKEEAGSFSSKIMKKATGFITSLNFTQGNGIYIKASLEPQEWFKDIKPKKTKRSSQNPPVFDEDLHFNISPDLMGVKKGGYLLMRLKVATSNFTCVHSEAVIPLLKIPVVQARRNNPHTYLGLSRPESVRDYKSLIELESRYEDKGATVFLNRLRDSFCLSS